MKIKKIIDLSDNLIKAYKKGNNNYYILSNLKDLSSKIKNNNFNNIDYSQLSKYIDDIVNINISMDKNFGFKNIWFLKNTVRIGDLKKQLGNSSKINTME